LPTSGGERHGFTANCSSSGVGQTTVAKYMAKRRRPPSQGWKTFLRNHADGIASIDMFVVPTISFQQLHGLLVLRHSRRERLWLGVTAHPSAEWIARQLTEACGWNEPPLYVIRDRDGAYGDTFIRRITAMGIRDRPISDCLDHVVVFNDCSISYKQYYNELRTHLSLDKDAPIRRDAQSVGRVLPLPILGGLHHQYVRI
jgi:hypothetical protein